MTRTGAVRTGGCLCGAVRFEVAGEPSRVAICHCRMCQRWSAGPFASAAEFSADQVDWEKLPTLFRSSDSVSRSFCSKCGSALGFQSSKGTVWITLGTLDDAGQMRPQFHLFTDEELPWAHLDDGLPHYRQSEPT
jgi:hypothetical protein